ICCGVKVGQSKAKVEASVKTAGVLLRRGLDVNREAFSEGSWKATPLWYSIARGQNLALAKLLLKRGSDPNHCLWAAAFNNDLDAIRLLVAHGADVNAVAEDETPFLGAIKWSRFRGAKELLRLGADVNFQDSKGMTALHYMLKKKSDKRHFRVLIERGARLDIPDRKGVAAADLMRRSRDPEFRAMAERA